MVDKRKGIRGLWKPLAIVLILSVAIWSLSSTPNSARASPMTTFKVEPETVTGRVGDIITVSVNVYDADDLWGWQVYFLWYPTRLAYVTHIFGDFLAGQPEGTAQTSDIDYVDDGELLCSDLTIGEHPGVDGDGWLLTVKFEVLSLTATTIDIDDPWTYWLDSALICYGDDADEMIKESGSYIPPWPEDISMDGLVDVLDLAYVAINYGKGPGDDIQPPEADVDGDGYVDIMDLSMVALKYGKYAGY